MSNKLRHLFYLILAVIFVGITIKSSNAQDRYWVNGSGSWNDTNHWAETTGGKSGASIPSSENNVIFDNNSFTASEQFVEIKEIVECNNLNWQVSKYSPTLKSKSFLFKSATKSELNVNGSLYINDNIDNQFFGDVVLRSKQEETINISKTLNSDVIINTVKGSYTLSSDLKTLSDIQFIQGSFNSNNNNITSNAIITIGSNRKVIDFGTSNIIVNIWDFEENENADLKISNSKIYLNDKISKRNFKAGNLPISNFASKPAGGTKGLSIILTPDSVSCYNGDNGSITVEVSGGVSTPYTFELHRGSYTAGDPDETIISSNNTETFTDLEADIYVIFVEESGGIPFTAAQDTVKQPDKLLPGNITITNDLTCFDGSDGELTANPSGGTPPLTYQWQEDLGAGYVDITDSTRQSLSGVAQGYYQVLINDQNGCGDVSSAIIFTRQFKPGNIPDSIHISNVSTTESCPTPADDGSVSITASGGTGIAGYYLIETSGSTRIPGAGLNATGSFTGLAPGTYETYAVDASACEKQGPDAIVAEKDLSTDPTGINSDNDNFCPGDAANLTVQGGSLGTGATWEWYSGGCGGTSVGSGSTINVSPAVTTTYYVRAEGDCNTTACVNITITVKTESTDPTGINTDNDNFCPGGTANLTVQGGSLGDGATWEWYSGSCGGTSVGSGPGISVSPAVTTTYYVRAEGDCNTTACASLTITVKTESTDPTGINTDANDICPGDAANLSIQGGSLGTGASWEWYTGSCGGVSVGSGPTLNVTPAVTTTYYVRAEGDCNTTACASLTITVKTESTDPTGINTDNDNFCPGGTANLTVQGGSLGDGATWEWYSGSCGGTPVGSGAGISVSPITTTTYYVRAEGDCNTTACASLTITVKTESTDPTGINTDNDNFCPGDAANLSIQGGSLGTGASWEWYTGSCGGTSVGSGPTLNVTPAVTTTYYVRAEGDCNTTACASLTITVKTESTDPTGINSDNDNFCPGDAANLTVQGGSLGTGATWEWYSGGCGGTSVGSGSTINVSPAVTTTYYVRAEGDCNTTACVNITITVKTESTDPTGINTDNDNFCPGGTANLTVQGGSLGDGATWEWYSGSCGGTSVGSGPGISVSPAVTTTYYVRAEGDCNTTACASLTITVKTESTDPTGINTDANDICPGDAANLSIQGGSLGTGASWEWYTGSCGGVSVGSGPTLNVTPAVTTTYYVRAEGDCNTTACASLTITVKTESTDPTGINTDNDNFCPGGTANLTVQGGSLGDGATWEWYSGSCGGTPVGSGAGISVSPITTTTYYVRAEGDCNTTACASLTITVKTESTDPTGINTDNDNFCPGDAANLSIQGGSLGTGASWEWYTGSCGGTSVGSGPTLNVTPAVTTTYYVRAEGDCNTTACASLTITVKTESTDPTGINSDNDNFCPGDAANLTVQGGSLGTGATWEWYSGGCGGTSVGSGSTINVSPAVTTTYYVRAEGDCNTTACVNITITVKTESTDPTGINTDNDNFCPGGTANLTVQGGSLGDGATWEWYSGSCGGTSVGSGPGISVSPAVTTTYYVRAEGDCNTTACASLTITVKTESTDPTGINTDANDICPGDAANLSIQGGSLGTGASWEWYTGSCGGVSVGSGPTLNVTPAVTTTYYVRAEGDCNTTACASLTITVKTESTDPTGINTDNDNFCVGESANLTVQGGSLGDGATWEWYSGSCGGTPVGSGAGISVSPITTTTYYVRAEGDCNTTACANITLTVYESPIAFAGEDTTLCYGTPYHILDADTTNSDGVNWEILTGNGSLDNLNIIDPEYTPDVLDGGTTVELVLHASGNGSCSEDTDTLRINYLNELTVSVGKPTPFFIDSTSTHVDVYMKITGHEYISLVGLYLVSPLDSIIELKPYCTNIPAGITTTTDIEYKFYNDPIDTASAGGLTPEDPCSVNSGRWLFAGDWKEKLHGQDPSNGAWRVMIKDTLNYGSPGVLEEATIAFTDTNDLSVLETVLYADSTISLNITGHTGSGPAAITTHTLPITGLTTSCFGLCDATAIATASGGLPPYDDNEFKWSTSLDFSSPFVTGDTVDLCAGTYYVQVTDSHGCTAIDSVTVGEPPEIYITEDTVVHNSCYGYNVGKVMLKFAGGTGALQYTYNGTDWYNSGDTIFNLAGDTTYTFTIQDVSGCTKDTSITINEPTAIDITTTFTPITCYEADDGEIQITATGGTPATIAPAYTYSIDSASTWFATNTFNSLGVDTFYIAVQDSLGCIQFGDTIEMLNPDTITIDSIKVNHVICDGSAVDGEIVVHAVGGTGDLDYSINNGVDYYPDSLFTGLSGGDYQISVRDERGCEKSLDTLVTINGPIIITKDTVVHNSCNGYSEGKVALEFTGGTGVLQYTFNGTDWYNSGDTIFNLEGDSTYTFTIQGDAGCTKDTSITINEPAAIDITTTFTPITCYETDDGEIQITATGGTPATIAPAYTYSIDSASTWFATNTFNSLGVDTFYIAVQDSLGCIQFGDTIEMLNPDTITIDSITVKHVICDGSAIDGELVVHAVGGTGDLDYSINNGVNYYPDSLFTGLSGGDYQISVRDERGCEKLLDTLVTINGPIIITKDTVVHNSCNGYSEGKVALEFTGGTGVLQYTFNGTDWYNSGDTIFNLEGDTTYTFTIQGDAGCSKDTLITINEPNRIEISTNIKPISCYGSDNGQIEIIASEGTPAYTYSIDSAYTWNAGNTFGSLPVDTFYIAVQDANGCIQFGDTIEMVNPDTIAIDSVKVIPTSCSGGGNDGQIIVYASGGAGTLEYSLDGTTYQSSNVFSGLSQCDTTVFVQDTCGFKQLDTLVSVTGPTPITIDIVDITDVSTCFGENTGRIEITASGGSGNFEYSNNGGADYQTNNLFIGLQAGTYTLSVRDDDGCLSPDSTVIVNQPPELIIDGFTVINASECNADLTGSVIVSATGGSGAYEYNADGGAFQLSDTLQGLDVGSHTFIVRDINGCTATDDTSIVLLDPLTATFESDSITCFGLSNGSATVNPVDGLPPYSYIWEDGETTSTISNKESGIYSVTITDSNLPTKCEFIGTVEIGEPEELQPNATPQNKRCITSPSRDHESSMGSVIVVPSGGTPGYTYDWDGPSGFDSNNDTILYLQPGNYSVTITDSRDCKTTYSTTLIEDASYDIPVYNVEFEDNTVCWNDNVIFENTFTEDVVNRILFQISEETSPNQWTASSWEVDVLGSPTILERQINYNTNFDYIRATNEYCYQDTTDILVEYLPSFQLDIIDELDGNAEDDTIYLKGARQGLLSAYVTDSVGITFEWFESDPVFSQDFPNTKEISIEPDSSAYYTVVATTDECVDTSRVYLEFIPAITPNEAFTPNGDGYNEYWKIKFIDKFTNNQVMVFNRWGLKVFEQQRYSNEDMSRAWDGRDKNGKELPSGTYYYVIILKEAGFEPITGSITIIR